MVIEIYHQKKIIIIIIIIRIRIEGKGFWKRFLPVPGRHSRSLPCCYGDFAWCACGDFDPGQQMKIA